MNPLITNKVLPFEKNKQIIFLKSMSFITDMHIATSSGLSEPAAGSSISDVSYIKIMHKIDTHLPPATINIKHTTKDRCSEANTNCCFLISRSVWGMCCLQAELSYYFKDLNHLFIQMSNSFCNLDELQFFTLKS